MSTGTYLQSNEAVAYGGIERPTEYGSGGGCEGGGKGGGVITLKATTSIQVDGLLIFVLLRLHPRSHYLLLHGMLPYHFL
jgi:hypothetical protein